MNDYDYDYDYLDDPNLYLPNHFVTCIASWQVPAYEKAVATFTAQYPDCQLELDGSGQWNVHRDTALLYYGRCGETNYLQMFWQHLDKVKKEVDLVS